MSVRSDSRRSALSQRLFCALSGREPAHSAGRTVADSSINECKTAFQSICRLMTVWNYKYEHSVSVNIMHFLFVICFLACCFSGSVLHETKK